MQNRNKFTKIQNQFHLKAVRGFGANKDKIIWDSGNVIQWMAAKEILMNKFMSEGVWYRFEGDVDQDAEARGAIEVHMEKEAPVFQEYVEDKLEALYTANNGYRDYNSEQNNELFNENHIDGAQLAIRLADNRMAHAKREVEIETVESHKFTNDYERAKIEYERSKEKFDKDTAKVVKVFNEALGPSARELVKDFLLHGEKVLSHFDLI